MQNGVPTASEMVRRLQRIEDRMDARILSTDVYAADKLTADVRHESVQNRLKALESTQGTAVKLLVGAMFGLLGQAVYIIVSVAQHGGPK